MPGGTAVTGWSQPLDPIDELSQRVDPSIRPAVEQLRIIATSEPPKYPPEMVNVLLRLLRETNTLIQQGETPVDAARATTKKASGYEQAGWNVENVFNILIANAGRRTTIPDVSPELVPVVMVVMTDDQAAELVDGRAFQHYPAVLSEDFAKMRTLLDNADLNDWVGRYHADPREWQPFGGAGPSLAEMVETTITRINENLSYTPPLAAEFISINTLNEDRSTLRRLRQRGCLVIMDSVSMRHPNVQRAFHHSMLDAFSTTSLVVMAPVAHVMEQVRQLTVVLELRIADLEFAKRLIDPDEEFGISLETTERLTLEQWLATRLRSMASSLGVKSGIRPYMRIQGPGD